MVNSVEGARRGAQKYTVTPAISAIAAL